MQRELSVKCGELGLPKSHRTKAQMVSNLIAYSEGEDLSQLQPLLGREMMEGPRQPRVAPYDLTGRPEVFEQPMNDAQTKSSGPRTIINPNRQVGASQVYESASGCRSETAISGHVLFPASECPRN